MAIVDFYLKAFSHIAILIASVPFHMSITENYFY